MPDIEKYHAFWPEDATDLEIEMACIKQGGFWEIDGRKCGAGLPHHYEAMRHILWPWLDDHRWNALCRDTILANKVTVLMGSGGSGKTHTPSWLFLCFYFCHPNNTAILVSSTDLRGLELRVWGEIKKLYQFATENYPNLAGHLIESKHAISTDNIDEEKARDLRKGIIGVPCIQNGKFVGLAKYVGIHQHNLLGIFDEAQFMNSSFLSAFPNFNNNPNFWAVILGNPNDISDCLGRAAEPVDGWSNHMQPEKTATWKTRFMDGTCVNLVGTDSPNFDFDQAKPTRYPYLPNARRMDETKRTWGEDSYEYHTQCVGTMRVGLMQNRVLTRDLCRQFRAQEDVIWKGTTLTRICALDAAWGGDRCVCGYIEFGEDIEGRIILSATQPMIVPIRVATNKSPEDQIAEFVKAFCESNNIPPENFFHDSTGRGSLGTALARVWSAMTNPVEFGGAATDRPISLDHFIYDAVLRLKRLKTCKEHYANFVTELWYTIRFAVEASQIRNLPDEVMEELCMRKWDRVLGTGRIQVEKKSGTPEKPGMKERTGRSPDMGDWLAIAVEGARRRGFNIAKLANGEADGANLDWLDKLREAKQKLKQRWNLTHK